MRGHRVEPRMRRMPSIRTGNFFPTRNERDLWWVLKGLGKHFAVHVFASRESVKRQDGGRDIQHRRRMQRFVFLNAWPAESKDAQIAILHRRPGGDVGNGCGPEGVGVEDMVRYE